MVEKKKVTTTNNVKITVYPNGFPNGTTSNLKSVIDSLDGMITSYDYETGQGKVYVWDRNKTYDFHGGNFNSGWPVSEAQVLDLVRVHFTYHSLISNDKEQLLSIRLRMRL